MYGASFCFILLGGDSVLTHQHLPFAGHKAWLKSIWYGAMALVVQAKFPVYYPLIPKRPKRVQHGPAFPRMPPMLLAATGAMATTSKRRALLARLPGLVWLGPMVSEAAPLRKAPELVKDLWGKGLRSGEDLSLWKTFLAEDCVYEDLYYAEPARGKQEVLELIQQKLLPANSGLILDSISDGKLSCGFTWHVEEKGVGIGQRGLCYVRLNSKGQVAYVRDLGEPLWPGFCLAASRWCPRQLCWTNILDTMIYYDVVCSFFFTIQYYTCRRSLARLKEKSRVEVIFTQVQGWRID